MDLLLTYFENEMFAHSLRSQISWLSRILSIEILMKIVSFWLSKRNKNDFASQRELD